MIFLLEFFLQGFLFLNNTFIRTVLITTVLVLSFLYLSNIVLKPNDHPKKWLIELLKPYVFFCLFNSVIGVIVFLLIQINIIHLENWSIPSFFQINQDFSSGRVSQQSMPLYLTLVNVDLFAGVHRFSGLSIEPHTYALFTTPAVFYLFYVFSHWSFRKKIIGIGIIIFHLILTISITFYSMFIIITLLFFIRNISFISKIKINHIVSILTLITVCIYTLISYYDFEFLLNTLENKLMLEFFYDQGYHTSVWADYLYPDYLVGTGLLISPEVREWGFIFLLLYSCVFIFSIIVGLWLFFKRSSESLLGLGIVYFFLHLIKDPMHSFPAPFLIYLYFVTALGMALSFMKPRHAFDQSINQTV